MSDTKIDFKDYYFDGHYVDSGLTQEERDKLAEEAIKENESLTDDWSKVDH